MRLKWKDGSYTSLINFNESKISIAVNLGEELLSDSSEDEDEDGYTSQNKNLKLKKNEIKKRHEHI